MLSIYSINKAVNEKRLTYTLIGKTRYYKREDIENYIKSNKIKGFSLRDILNE